MTEPNETGSPVEADGRKDEDPELAEAQQTATWSPEPGGAAPAPAPAAAQEPVADAAGGATDRPEVPVAAAFAGGFLLALLLRRLAR